VDHRHPPSRSSRPDHHAHAAGGQAFSTSGDYERYFDEDGVRYHHIIDPHTGHSASKVRSATVIAPTATRTDGLSKTAFVLGPTRRCESTTGSTTSMRSWSRPTAGSCTPGACDHTLQRYWLS
jgi:thiamine biosynthesis lipoprotein ApbE